jgi:gamma-glutamyltranspeptidase/glutathione hydrolase
LQHKPIFARNGVVATSQHLASQVGLTILKQGGNAVDAALAAAITLTVVEAPSCGIGGDLFALVWDGTTLHGLNGSGRAPVGLTPEVVRQSGYEQMPDHGWFTVTVPGAPAAWRDLHQRFGKLPFPQLFTAAIEYAERGHPISPTVFFNWRWAVEVTHATLQGQEYNGFGEVFAPNGHTPQLGEVWRNADMAHTLQRIAESYAQDFYTGEIAEKIADFSARTGGVLTFADLEAHSSTWVEPISTNYRGYDVWEIPPNGQGLTVLLALNILEGFELSTYPRESPESYHLQIEAIKLAFAEAQRYIADPERVPVP